MALQFWRSIKGALEDLGHALEVDENHPLPVQIVTNEDEDVPKVQIDQPQLPPVQGQTLLRLYDVPGIGTGAVYDAGEAFGTPFTLHSLFGGKISGTIVGVVLFDLDDEGIQVDLPIFTQSLAGTTDNNAFAPTDTELLTCRAVFPITEFYNWSVNQFGQYVGTPKWIVLEGPNAYTQLVVQGAPNIAAGALPRLAITTVPD